MTISTRRLVPGTIVALVLAASTVAAAPSADALGPAFGSYQPTGPTRVLDTRTAGGAVGPGGKVAVTVTGAGVPISAETVALTISVVSATRAGSITASTDGVGSAPNVTNVQFRPGVTATDLALVQPTNGKIDLWNESPGRVQLVADVLGYYVGGGTPTADGMLRPLPPSRAVPFGQGLIRAHKTLNVHLHATAGLPSTAGAVAATVTVVGPARAGSLVAWATRTTRPAVPLLDFDAGRSVSQFAILPVSDIQQLSLLNKSRGSLHVLVDVVGWLPAGPAASAQSEQVVAANRIFADDAVPAHGTDTVGVLGRGGVPKSGVSAVVISTRVTGPKRAGTLVAGSGAGPIVTTFAAGRTTTGQAILPVHNGSVRLRNASNGKLALEVDIAGYVVSSTLTPPTSVSVARYANDLIDVNSPANLTTDKNLMFAHGQDDSAATFALLDLGAQTITAPLSRANPGIALTKTNTVRLSYRQLVKIIQSYIDGIATGGHHVTLAVGTNNDGTWTTYRAAARGRQFANDLIDPLRTYGSLHNVTVVGANDIEADFGSQKVTDALDWLSAYLANTSADFVYNGALLNCPTVFGMRSACDHGWTQKQYGQLTRRVVHGHNRISVLPQIYFPIQAVQWANIEAHAGPLNFVGSLTQFASDPTTFRPEQGWAALRLALQSVVANPHLPRVVDILTP